MGVFNSPDDAANRRGLLLAVYADQTGLLGVGRTSTAGLLSVPQPANRKLTLGPSGAEGAHLGVRAHCMPGVTVGGAGPKLATGALSCRAPPCSTLRYHSDWHGGTAKRSHPDSVGCNCAGGNLSIF